MMEPVELANGVQSPCPCGGTATLLMEPEPCVLHTLPVCKKYLELDALAFAVYVRKSLEN